MALGLTQALVKISTRNISWGLNAAGAWGWRPHHLHVQNVMKIWEPKPPETLWATPGLLRDDITFVHKTGAVNSIPLLSCKILSCVKMCQSGQSARLHPLEAHAQVPRLHKHTTNIITNQINSVHKCLYYSAKNYFKIILLFIPNYLKGSLCQEFQLKLRYKSSACYMPRTAYLPKIWPLIKRRYSFSCYFEHVTGILNAEKNKQNDLWVTKEWQVYCLWHWSSKTSLLFSLTAYLICLSQYEWSSDLKHWRYCDTVFEG